MHHWACTFTTDTGHGVPMFVFHCTAIDCGFGSLFNPGLSFCDECFCLAVYMM